MQDGQHGAVASRVEEFVRVPTGRHRTSFSLTIANNARNDQVRTIESRAVSMREGVTQFSAFVNGAGRLWRNMAGDAARKRELFEQPFYPCLVLRNIRIHFRVGSFQIS